jgi:hypothetical protein
MKKRWTLLIACGFLICVVSGMWVSNILLSRGDRIHIESEKSRMLKLADSIILFAKDKKRFPDKLDELIPGYCSEKEIRYRKSRFSDVTDSYKWDCEAGELSFSDAFLVSGRYSGEKKYPKKIKIEKLPVKHDPLSGNNVFSQPQNNIQVGQDSVVLEMENMQHMTYGWEIGESEDASGGVYLMIKEGIGDFESEDAIAANPGTARSGDFYNITRDSRRIQAGLSFEIPDAGNYAVFVRTMAQQNNCSNMTYLKLNEYPRSVVGHNGSQPFAWRWHQVGQYRLDRGVNQLCFMTYQDGVRIDQVLITRMILNDIEGNTTFTGGFRAGMRHLESSHPPLNFSFSADTLNITAEKDPVVYIYVHKNIAGQVDARLDIQIDLPGGKLRRDSNAISLEKELTRFPCRIELPRPLDRKEYLLKAVLFMDEKIVEERTLVLSHGFDWQILGPLPYMKNDEQGLVESDKIPKSEYSFNDTTFQWRIYSENNTDPLCLLDFGMMFSGRTYNAMSDVCLYAFTEINAGREGIYLMKTLSDDNIVVWVNGKKTASITEKGPPIRTAQETRISLDKGKNQILFRLNQNQGQWQAGIRIRTEDDQIAEITGVSGSDLRAEK